VETLTPDGARVLSALRAATLLRREPKVLSPDGYEHWWSLARLADSGWLAPDADQAALSRAARGLYKKHLVQIRTIFTVTSWRITEAGLLALAAMEARAGISGYVAAELELNQAVHDQARANAHVAEATARLRAESERLPGNIAAVITAALSPRGDGHA
jgi:hypothetical protein